MSTRTLRWIVLGASVLSACGSSESNTGSVTGDGGALDASAPGSGGANGGDSGSSTGGRRATGGAPSTGGSAPGDAAATGGSSSTDGGTQTGGASSTDAPAGSGGGSPGDACDVLALCCPTSGIFQASCEMIASQGMTAQCTVTHDLFCGAGDGGPAPGGDGGAACATLETCCASQTGQNRAQCEQVVGLGLDFACSALQVALCP
jgi:hypothetical protein